MSIPNGHVNRCRAWIWNVHRTILGMPSDRTRCWWSNLGRNPKRSITRTMKRLIIILLLFLSSCATETTFTVDELLNDGIMLTQHNETGEIACFGCSQMNKGKAMCIDPISEMKQIEETRTRYCNNDFEVIYDDNIGESCNNNNECETPMDFLIQSNCPFGSACIDNQCRVVCPLFYYSLEPDVMHSYQYICENDTECDCSERQERTLECRCIDNKCLSIEK